MKLGIDIDGTIKHTQSAAIKVYNEELNMDIKEDEVTTYYLDEPYGITGEEGAVIWRRLEATIYKIGIPLDHASEVLQQMIEEGHEVYFITARPGFERIRKITEEWLTKHNFPFNGKNLYMNSLNKGKIACKIGIDLFFEDDPDHINNLLAAGIPTVIMDMKYNRDYSKDMPRITDWQEGLKYIQEFEKILSKANKTN